MPTKSSMKSPKVDHGMVEREATSLMLKARYYLGTRWEFERMVRYVRDHHEEMASAGRDLLQEDSEDVSDLL